MRIEKRKRWFLVSALTTQEAKKLNNPANKSKRKDGYVFCTLNGVTGFHDIKKIPLADLNGLTLEQFISETNKQVANIHKRVDKVEKDYKEAIAQMKGSVAI